MSCIKCGSYDDAVEEAANRVFDRAQQSLWDTPPGSLTYRYVSTPAFIHAVFDAADTYFMNGNFPEPLNYRLRVGIVGAAVRRFLDEHNVYADLSDVMSRYRALRFVDSFRGRTKSPGSIIDHGWGEDVDEVYRRIEDELEESESRGGVHDAIWEHRGPQVIEGYMDGMESEWMIPFPEDVSSRDVRDEVFRRAVEIHEVNT